MVVMSPFLLTALCLLPLIHIPPIKANPASGLSCGALLPGVGAYCGHPTKASTRNCCDALRTWNDARCWCEPAAFSALSAISGNRYAFTGRASACNITKRYTPELYTRDSPQTRSSCPSDFRNTSAEIDGEGCRASGVKLRKMRTAAVDTFDNLQLNSDTADDLSAFNRSVVTLLTSSAYFMNIGQITVVGISPITDYLLARQSSLGCTAPIYPSHDRHALFWRDTNSASYVLTIETTDGKISTRYVYLAFAKCTARLSAVYIAESSYISAVYAQFFYTRGPTDVIGQFDISASALCQSISDACQGDMYPYQGRKECVDVVENLRKEGKVMCNRFNQSYVPQLAIHGNSVACRATFVHVARIRPRVYCPVLGEEDVGVCSERACPYQLYSDIFNEANPRHDGSAGGFSCKRDTGTCVEQWP